MSTPRILLVEDQPLGAMALRHYLEFDKLQVDTVSSAEEALWRITQAPPYTAIITDLRLPGISGQEFASRLRGPLFVALSGDSAVHAAHHFGLRLQKPCNREELDHLVQFIKKGRQP